MNTLTRSIPTGGSSSFQYTATLVSHTDSSTVVTVIADRKGACHTTVIINDDDTTVVEPGGRITSMEALNNDGATLYYRRDWLIRICDMAWELMPVSDINFDEVYG